eukprot:403364734
MKVVNNNKNETITNSPQLNKKKDSRHEQEINLEKAVSQIPQQQHPQPLLQNKVHDFYTDVYLVNTEKDATNYTQKVLSKKLSSRNTLLSETSDYIGLQNNPYQHYINDATKIYNDIQLQNRIKYKEFGDKTRKEQKNVRKVKSTEKQSLLTSQRSHSVQQEQDQSIKNIQVQIINKKDQSKKSQNSKLQHYRSISEGLVTNIQPTQLQIIDKNKSQLIQLGQTSQSLREDNNAKTRVENKKQSDDQQYNNNSTSVLKLTEDNQGDTQVSQIINQYQISNKNQTQKDLQKHQQYKVYFERMQKLNDLSQQSQINQRMSKIIDFIPSFDTQPDNKKQQSLLGLRQQSLNQQHDLQQNINLETLKNSNNEYDFSNMSPHNKTLKLQINPLLMKEKLLQKIKSRQKSISYLSSYKNIVNKDMLTEIKTTSQNNDNQGYFYSRAQSQLAENQSGVHKLNQNNNQPSILQKEPTYQSYSTSPQKLDNNFIKQNIHNTSKTHLQDLKRASYDAENAIGKAYESLKYISSGSNLESLSQHRNMDEVLFHKEEMSKIKLKFKMILKEKLLLPQNKSKSNLKTIAQFQQKVITEIIHSKFKNLNPYMNLLNENWKKRKLN